MKNISVFYWIPFPDDGYLSVGIQFDYSPDTVKLIKDMLKIIRDDCYKYDVQSKHVGCWLGHTKAWSVHCRVWAEVRSVFSGMGYSISYLNNIPESVLDGCEQHTGREGDDFLPLDESLPKLDTCVLGDFNAYREQPFAGYGRRRGFGGGFNQRANDFKSEFDKRASEFFNIPNSSCSISFSVEDIRNLAILNLGWPTSVESIASSFRSLAKKRHPDTGGSHEEFLSLQEAKGYCERLVRIRG